jgi:hypothetical protein
MFHSKSFANACLGALVLATGVTAPLPCAGADGPRLRISPAILDFGERGHMEHPRLTLTLANDGSAPLTITELKPSCSCIELRPASIARPLAPGEKVEIAVTMGSGRAIGSLDKYIAIHTGGSAPALEVPARMRVFEGLRQEPYDIAFEGVVGGQPVTRSVDLVWTRGRAAAAPPDLQVEDVVSAYRREDVAGPIARFFAHRVEDIPQGKRLHITVLPDHPEGRIAATVRCRLDGRTLEVPVRGEMFRCVLVSPTSLNFNRVEIDKPATVVSHSRLSSTDGRAFSVLGTEVRTTRTDTPGLGLAVTPRSEDGGKKWLVEARIRVPGPVLPTGSFTGKILVRTDHPEKPEIELLFFGFFPRSSERRSSRQDK